jgi:hypothetical protein
MDLITAPQEQAKRHAAVFVDKEDGKDRVLIVCYGGHGNGGGGGRLLLSGCQLESPPPEGGRLYEQIDWTEVEIVLSKAKADVLVILDCCHAGVLFEPEMMSRAARRKFQYIAACKTEPMTRSAGPGSFTAAIIWALKDLAKEPGFTTQQLVCSLSGCKDFSCETQEAFLFPDKFGLVTEDIWIASVTGKPLETLGKNQERSESEPRTANVLDLRFHLAPNASESDIEATADHLETFLRFMQNLQPHKVSFLGHQSHNREPETEDGRELAKDGELDGPIRGQNSGLLHLVSRALDLT